MLAEVARLDLRARRRALLGYCGGMGLYALVIVALYPQFRDSTSLDNITKNAPTLSALFGAVGSLTSPAGWLDANIYENFLPLVILMLSVGYGAAAIAGANQEGTLGLVVTLPTARFRILGAKVLALIAQGLILSLTVAVVVVAGRGFQLPVPTSHVAEVSLAVFLLGADFGLVTLAIGAATGSRGLALGLGSGAAAGSYLISSLAPVVAWIRPARFASLFYWAVGNDQLIRGVTWLELLVLALVGVIASILAAGCFDRLDLR